MIFITNLKQIDWRKNTILYFYHDDLNYNDKFIAMIKKIEQNNNIYFYAINLNMDKNLHVRFKIKSIPSLIFYKNDINTYKHEVLLNFQQFEKLIKKIYN